MPTRVYKVVTWDTYTNGYSTCRDESWQGALDRTFATRDLAIAYTVAQNRTLADFARRAAELPECRRDEFAHRFSFSDDYVLERRWHIDAIPWSTITERLERRGVHVYGK